jgi:hypothetical protein
VKIAKAPKSEGVNNLESNGVPATAIPWEKTVPRVNNPVFLSEGLRKSLDLALFKNPMR